MGGFSGSINTADKAQLKKIQKLKIKKELEQVPLSDLYVRKDGAWHYKGVSCRLCGGLMADKRVIDKHRYICEVLNKKKEEKND